MESNEKFATYKEFGKMLREVADLCAKLGDTPLYDSAPDLKEKVFYVVNRGAYDASHRRTMNSAPSLESISTWK